ALHGHHLTVDRLDYPYLRVCECLLQTNLHTIPICYQTHYKARIHLQEKHLQVQYLNSHPILHYELETYLAIYYNNAHHQGSTHLPMDTVSAPIHLLQPGPSGQFHTAPSTTTHQGAACTRCSHFFKVSSLKNISNTNDQPNCSASVTYPVSSMNLLNSAFVTAVASIKKGPPLFYESA